MLSTSSDLLSHPFALRRARALTAGLRKHLLVYLVAAVVGTVLVLVVPGI